MHQSQIFNIVKLSFNVICENRILTKISEFTVNEMIFGVIADITGLHQA